MLYVDVIVKQRSKVEELTYAVPASMVPYIRCGSLVSIPLRKKIVDGIVVALRQTVSRELKGKIKPVATLERDKFLSESSIAVMRQLARHYGASLGEVGFHALDQPYVRALTDKKTVQIRPTFIQATLSERFDTYCRLIHKLAGSSFVCVFAQKTFAKEFVRYAKEKGIAALLTDDTARFQKQVQSALEAGERLVLVTTGAGTFLPLTAGDALIVDQPSHIGLKQQQRPYMRVKTIARIRAEVEHLRLFYGDDLSEVEDVVRFQKKEWTLKVGHSQYPPLTVMSRLGSSAVLLPNVIERIGEVAKHGGRCLIVTLARGWASALVCRECGYLFQCPACKRTLAVERGGLVCRYDDTKVPQPRSCPKCRSTELREVGEGVARISSEVNRLLPSLPLQELSSDQPVLAESGIVVATEKILSYPLEKFDLVILASVDRLLAGVALNDRWELVRLLRILSSHSGEILVQTHIPDDPIWSLSPNNIRSFYVAELSERRRWKLPPYGQLIQVVAHGVDEVSLRNAAADIRELIGQRLPSIAVGSLVILPLGPKRFRAALTLSARTLSLADRQTIAGLLPHAWHLDTEPID
jgi:primosomal protein N'